MIARCATCPFWEQNSYQIVEQNNYGQCGKSADVQSDMEELADKLLLATNDGENEYVSTRADYGCVLHPANKAIA